VTFARARRVSNWNRIVFVTDNKRTYRRLGRVELRIMSAKERLLFSHEKFPWREPRRRHTSA
jgi:hypothetical protein